MRRDLVLALLVSLLIHGGVAGFGELFRQPVVHVVHDVEPAIVPLTMPPLEPDPPPPEDRRNDPKPDIDLGPPTLPDPPVLIRDPVFVQPPEPPRPESHVDKGTVFIPVDRPPPGTGPEIFNPDVLDQQPRATYQAKPNYPFELRRHGVTGQVVVGFIVDATGAVRDAYAISSTDREFESSAVQAVMHWKFKPGKKAGRPVNTRMQVPILFSISLD